MTVDHLGEIAAYYDYTEPFYRRFWHGETGGVHYGLWDSGTKKFRDALLNANRFLACAARIGSSDKILDAGCGVGGSALWLAANTGARVTGITISRKQLMAALVARENRGLARLVDFQLRDFTRTGLPDASFDVFWAMESVCHARDKHAVLNEAYRVLKPGGRIVLADGFLDREPFGGEVKKLGSFYEGLVVPSLARLNDFESALADAGFNNIRRWDKTDSILRSSRRMRWMSLWSWPLSMLTERLGLTPHLLTANNRAGLDQFELFSRRVLAYYVFLATKA